MMMTLNYQKTIGTGGNASTMLIEYGYRKVLQLARVTWTYNFDQDTRMHRILYDQMSTWIPRIRESVNFGSANPPKNVRELLKKTPESAALLKEMKNDRDRVATLTIMDYAEGGDFDHNVSPVDTETIRLVISEVLLFLYCAQVRLGFQHGDLHGRNVVMASGQPKVIDFDFSTFYTQRQYGAAHGFGTDFIMPPELQGELNYPPGTLLGAADVWALGLMLVSKIMGVFNILRDLLVAQGWDIELDVSKTQHWKQAIYWVQNTLQIAPYNPELAKGWFSGIAPTRETQKWLDTMYQKIVVEQPEVHEVCLRMLHANQAERTYHGALFRYFELPYFRKRSGMSKRVRQMALSRLHVKGTSPLPLTTAYDHQVENLIESGIHFQCASCETQKEDLHVCRNTGYVVCDMQCWNEIHYKL